MSGAPADAAKAKEGTTKSRNEAVSEEVCQSIEKGMKLISDIEQTRADGMVFKFELDLMYEVSAPIDSFDFPSACLSIPKPNPFLRGCCTYVLLLLLSVLGGGGVAAALRGLRSSQRSYRRATGAISALSSHAALPSRWLRYYSAPAHDSPAG